MGLFIGGAVRTSTVVLIVAFVLVGFISRPRYRALLACAAWLAGFEAFDMLAGIAAAVVRSGHPLSALATLARHWPLLAHDALIWYLPGIGLVVLAAKLGVRVDWRLAALTAALWIAWWATGWHVNGHSMAGLDPLGEALNEAVKTAWALAYLIPLLALGLRQRAEFGVGDGQVRHVTATPNH